MGKAKPVQFDDEEEPQVSAPKRQNWVEIARSPATGKWRWALRTSNGRMLAISGDEYGRKAEAHASWKKTAETVEDGELSVIQTTQETKDGGEEPQQTTQQEPPQMAQ